MNHRNRDLLDLAYELECTARIPGVCEGGRGEPAHSNQSIHGKGMSIKAHDHFFASCCRACHREIDQGNKLSKEERIHYWNMAYIRTQNALWEGKFLKVSL